MTMVATSVFEFGGRMVFTGQTFEVRPIEAAMLTYRKLARFATPAEAVEETRVIEPEDAAPVPIEPPQDAKPRRRRRRRSQRRDLVHE